MLKDCSIFFHENMGSVEFKTYVAQMILNTLYHLLIYLAFQKH